LLEDSDDALRTVVGLLDDVAPECEGQAPSPLDLHLAIAILDRVYEIQSTGELGDVSDFRRSLGAACDRFTDPADTGGP
jgi:hypothetical protein